MGIWRGVYGYFLRLAELSLSAGFRGFSPQKLFHVRKRGRSTSEKAKSAMWNMFTGELEYLNPTLVAPSGVPGFPHIVQHKKI